jgi:hypothetical protein
VTETPANEPPTPADLDRIMAAVEGPPPESLIMMGNVAPLVRRLVEEVRRLVRENERLRERVRNLES